MDVWRIGYCPTPAPSAAQMLATLGFGATRGNGRWHRSGPLMLVYAASSRALAMLEKRVHSNDYQPVDQALVKLTLPEDSEILDVATRYALPADWREQEALTQEIGIDWLTTGASLAMWVPSYVVTREKNLLINPTHPDYARISLEIEDHPFEFDPRLFET